MSSREAFEAWVDSNFPFKKDRFDLFRGEYKSQFTKQLWQSWQASREGLDARLKSAENNDVDARCHVAELEAKFAALAAENTGMDAFVEALLSIAWQGGSADGAEIQDLALKHGLLRQKVYSADEHETLVDDPGNFEDGDPVYFRIETSATDAFLAEVRAQGVDVAISELNQLAERSEKEAPIAAEHHRSAALYLQLFAAQLRQEVAQ